MSVTVKVSPPILYICIFMCGTCLWGQRSKSTSTIIPASGSITSFHFNLKNDDINSQHILDPNSILSHTEQKDLNSRLRIIKENKGIDVRILLFTTTPHKGSTSKDVARGLFKNWGSTNSSTPSDSSIIVVYDRMRNDFGYTVGISLRNKFDQPLIRTKEGFSKKVKQQEESFYPYLFDLLLSIESPHLYEIKLEREENLKKKELEKENNQLLATRVERGFVIIFPIITLVALFFWIRYRGRVAEERFAFYEDVEKNLNDLVFQIAVFFFLAYPVIVFIICLFINRRVADINADNTGTIFFVTGLFMFFGWIPAYFLVQREEDRLADVKLSRSSINNHFERYENQTGNNSIIPENRSPQININRASVEQIMSISKILSIHDAERIVNIRRSGGQYNDIEDLQRRTRLGGLFISALRPHVLFFPEEHENATTPQKNRSTSYSNSTSAANNNKVDINIATVEQIKNLSNLLTSMDVRKIIQEREKNGAFVNINDLQRRVDLPVALIKAINGNVVFIVSDEDKRKDGRRIIDL